jgi:hypothetical protein
MENGKELGEEGNEVGIGIGEENWNRAD